MKLYGRAMRHKDVLQCPISSFGFMLYLCFHLSGEMSPPPDFTINKSWFDIKLLADCNFGKRENKCMSNYTYSKSMKSVLSNVGITSKHYVHLGRVLGPVYLEYMESESEDIRILGNWDPKTQESRYSTKIPMKAIRTMAGFGDEGGHFNPRTMVEPPEDLQNLIFPFAEQCLKDVEEKQMSDDVDRYTAIHFLKLLIQLRRIILQDAAVMLLIAPDRISNPFFHLPVFKHELFKNFQETMKLEISLMKNPFDSKVESVLPGVLTRLSSIQTSIDTSKGSLMKKIDQSSKNLLVSLENESSRTKMEIAKHFATVAQSLAASSSTELTSLTLPMTGTDDEDEKENKEQQFKKPRLYIPEKIKDYRMNRNFRNLKHLFNQYYGLGEFHGIPVEGGVNVLEEKYGSSWRKNFTGSEQVHLSRVSRIAKCLNQQSEENRRNVLEVIGSLEKMFKDCKFSVYNMVISLQNHGYMVKTKQQRGRG